MSGLLSIHFDHHDDHPYYSYDGDLYDTITLSYIPRNEEPEALSLGWAFHPDEVLSQPLLVVTEDEYRIFHTNGTDLIRIYPPPARFPNPPTEPVISLTTIAVPEGPPIGRRLFPRELPPFNPDWLRILRRLQREHLPLEGINSISTPLPPQLNDSPKEESFRKSYEILVSRLYGLQLH